MRCRRSPLGAEKPKQYNADDIAYTGEASVPRDDRADRGKSPYRHGGTQA